MGRGTVARVQLSNLRHNLKVLKSKTKSRLVLVVKADAYGHGLKQVVSGLKNVDCFAVATIDEALTIRNIRLKSRILLLEGFHDPQELQLASENNIDCVIHNNKQLNEFLSLKTNHPINIWLKYDSGMNRLGFSDTEYQHAITQLEQNKELYQELTLMSHFASANESETQFTNQQIQRFLKFASKYPISLSNSAAVLNPKLAIKEDWSRIGLALYGVSPIEGHLAKDYGLRPAMTLKSNIIALKTVKQGESIGYGQKYIATSDMKIAILGIGYGDGYPWMLTDTAYVLLGNNKLKILGKVSMDMMAVDVSNVNSVKLGQTVLIWGEDQNSKLPVEIVASNAQTIPYVLLCGLTSRVKFIYD
jgi:alanine racemase